MHLIISKRSTHNTIHDYNTNVYYVNLKKFLNKNVPIKYENY